MATNTRATTIIAWGLGIVVLVFSVFFVAARSAVEFRSSSRDRSSAIFDSVRASLGDRPPMIAQDGRRENTPDVGGAEGGAEKLTRLGVLAYRASERKLATADVPFWFVRLKSPAVELLLRGTRVDLEELGIRASDLQRHGPGLVVDRTDPSGDRLLIWVE